VYGAAVEKQMYGKTVRGTNRISYLVNREGKIAKVYPNVDPANHAIELLTDLKQIMKEEKKAAKLATEAAG
jgi:peroxiredoxin Q/BCP